MTDNEIIKALECCNKDSSKGCWDCPYHQYSPACLEKRNVDALDLINRQKAEIERLQKTGEEAVSCFHRMESLYNIKRVELKVAKAEAIKEFAERLKENTVAVKLGKQICKVITVEGIDYLVKEMVGDAE